ncbi:MAG: glycosyltransferase [Actinomycetota bacterium]|nr:glycosyltransferase [Actinomycetota bacterium]
MDEIARGVGASQVLPYVEGLARRGAQVALHSFEHEPRAPAIRQRLDEAGVEWHAHQFRGRGSIAGAGRVLQAAALVRGATMVHARSDLPAAAAMLARSHRWVWDVRSFWADQRVAMGMLRQGSPQERVLRAIESSAAERSSAITTLTAAAIDVLAARHGEAIRAKATVIPTCVDLDRFPLAPMPDPDRIQMLLSGSFNRLYDQDVTFRFFQAVRRVRPAALTLVRPKPTQWDRTIIEIGGALAAATFAEMPAHIRASHVGLAICRTDNTAAIAGAAPTKLAEFLSTGRPVVVNAGLGDMDNIINHHHCGVILTDHSEDAVDQSARALDALLNDDLTPTRCRMAAEEHFDLELGISKLIDVYERVLQG